MSRKRFLLDTNIVSDLVRNPSGRIAIKIRDSGEESIAVSIITAAELRYGCRKKGSKTLSAQVNKILEQIEILPVEEPCDHFYAEIRHQLQSRGEIIGGNDLLIASQAIATSRILVTANFGEFSRVSGLKIENWLAHP